ncbi:conserved hypothetical protein [Trichormus variabilis ATCC 29413]|uniref:Uncharacterized protein n=1 Tax=Trichormus variabilis (strain ATCC 29413 / PCC 7937) TaxID=240292 RepID=Q3M6L3_TRIV2|nr:conserved hypothetical protein [Trichormus variabilis ATCC 29413]
MLFSLTPDFNSRQYYLVTLQKYHKFHGLLQRSHFPECGSPRKFFLVLAFLLA